MPCYVFDLLKYIVEETYKLVIEKGKLVRSNCNDTCDILISILICLCCNVDVGLDILTQCRLHWHAVAKT